MNALSILWSGVDRDGNRVDHRGASPCGELVYGPGKDKHRESALKGDELTLRTQDVGTQNGPATSALVWRRRQ